MLVSNFEQMSEQRNSNVFLLLLCFIRQEMFEMLKMALKQTVLLPSKIYLNGLFCLKHDFSDIFKV